ncbi:M14 family metallocarboxypeptidase [Puniceicoccus vermicola]|uniref:M14 family metallocarboxypeptidase n=1 Tax=Puniceicoccus vermicola TaxID=388746 RepID=A0A7X1B4L1_9BACT|nr:M14 family metallocarboxypeptidase [Puniceicoccus vermicola]
MNREKGREQSPPGDLFSVPEYLERIRDLGVSAGFSVEMFAEVSGFSLPVLTRNLNAEKSLYVSSGVHGDEPAGPLAIAQALESGAFSDEFGWVIFPVLNPTGLVRGTRETADGVDLNRDYKAFQAAESVAHCRCLAGSGWKFQAALGLHEDWEAQGGYLYEHNPRAYANPCQGLLFSIERTVGLDASGEIDGWPTTSPGLIHPPSNPELRDLWPEQIYLLQHHTTMSYTLETPSEFPLEKRVNAHAEALRIFGDPLQWIEDRRRT